jgi:hypothetical protein
MRQYKTLNERQNKKSGLLKVIKVGKITSPAEMDQLRMGNERKLRLLEFCFVHGAFKQVLDVDVLPSGDSV